MKKYNKINADLDDVLLNRQNSIDWNETVDFEAIVKERENFNNNNVKKIKYFPRNNNTSEYLGGPCGPKKD